MGSHRAEPGTGHGPSETLPAPATTPYVGRRAARPADPAAVVVETTPATPYVGRRVARVATPAAPAAPAAPVPTITPAAPLFVEPAVRRRLDPSAPADTNSFVFGDLEVTAELPLAAAQQAGRRRATRHDGARGPLFRGLPSAPVLLGVATLAVAVGGAVASGGAPALAGNQTPALRQATALGGTSGVASSTGARGPSLSRDNARQALAQSSGSDVAAPSTEAFAQHDQALQGLAAQAEHQAARLNNNRWELPVSGYHLTARFGDTGLWASFHTGLDFACATGTPIHAIASGIVTFAGYDGAYGNKTVITLPDGTELWFGHQTTQYVQVGDTVTRGQVIGTVGSTGHVTGPHVHIEVRPGGGDPVDPYPAFLQHGVTP